MLVCASTEKSAKRSQIHIHDDQTQLKHQTSKQQVKKILQKGVNTKYGFPRSPNSMCTDSVLLSAESTDLQISKLQVWPSFAGPVNFV